MLRIITDSASDLPKEYIEAHNLHVIPTPVVIDETDYFDGKTIQTKEFYNILDDTKRDVRTYHINPAMFEEAFLPYAQAGDSIIYICFSTGIAGTFNAANIAKTNVLEQYPDFDLTIIDSKSASIGFGLLVSKLVTMLEKGAPKKIIVEAANYFISHMHHVFTVHTLAYLIKGGRLSKFKGTIAETLDMKPILIVDKEGSLQVLKTVRGRKKSMKALIDYAKANGYDLPSQTLAICHGEDEDALQFLLGLADAELKPNDKLISTVGCAIREEPR
ncbi:MAG: DegV family protein [Lachnospiraceae bacterium]|nr:DegV family protein [Lachnospiraceae bacterium]